MTTATVLDDPDAVLAALSPLRRRMLRLLASPGSATSVARKLDLPRQKVNYHLRELERHGLVELVDERPRRGLTERFFRTVAHRMLVDPHVLSPPDRRGSAADRFAAEQLAETAAQAVHDVGVVMRAAGASGRRVATFTLDGELTFASPDAMREFVAALGDLVAQFDRPDATGGRRHKFIALSHPAIIEEPAHE